MACSAIDVDGNGRVDKSTVLQALQQKGESYDKARETLKHVGVDASGKVELEDWVEVKPRITSLTETILIPSFQVER